MVSLLAELFDLLTIVLGESASMFADLTLPRGSRPNQIKSVFYGSSTIHDSNSTFLHVISFL